ILEGDDRPSSTPPRFPSPGTAATTSPRWQRSRRTTPPSPGTCDRPSPMPQPDPADQSNRVSPWMLAPNPSQHLESEIPFPGNPYLRFRPIESCSRRQLSLVEELHRHIGQYTAGDRNRGEPRCSRDIGARQHDLVDLARELLYRG